VVWQPDREGAKQKVVVVMAEVEVDSGVGSRPKTVVATAAEAWIRP
jgi:hypothetical protein